MKKQCRKCGQEKELSEFHIDRSKKDGRKNICKLCLSSKRHKNPDIDKNIKQNIRYCIKNDGPFRWSKILGFSKQELINQLTSHFQDDMTMENYGTLWCVSFFIGRRFYVFNNIFDNEFKKLYSLKNIKPEYISETKKNKNKISYSIIEQEKLYDILPNGSLAFLTK